MKSLEELKIYYNQNLLPDLERLESVRLANIKKMVTIILPIGVGGLVLAMLLSGHEDGPGVVLGITFIVSAIIFAQIIRGYVNDFKEVVIRKIIQFIEPSLKYEPKGYIDRNAYTNSRLFLKRPDVYKGDDRVTGTLGATAVDFSELLTQYITRDSKGNRRHHTIFKGLFFIGDFNKHFKGRTFVLPDKAERLFGGIGKMFQSWANSRPELIHLEDPEFEKLFVVYGDDQIEARYILSPSLMRRIVDFKKKAGRSVRVGFLDSNVYIAISYTKNLFEPRIFQTLLNFAPVQEYFEDLQLATGIVEDLNLNLRIWTKE